MFWPRGGAEANGSLQPWNACNIYKFPLFLMGTGHILEFTEQMQQLEQSSSYISILNVFNEKPVPLIYVLVLVLEPLNFMSHFGFQRAGYTLLLLLFSSEHESQNLQSKSSYECDSHRIVKRSYPCDFAHAQHLFKLGQVSSCYVCNNSMLLQYLLQFLRACKSELFCQAFKWGGGCPINLPFRSNPVI